MVSPKHQEIQPHRDSLKELPLYFIFFDIYPHKQAMNSPDVAFERFFVINHKSAKLFAKCVSSKRDFFAAAAITAVAVIISQTKSNSLALNKTSSHFEMFREFQSNSAYIECHWIQKRQRKRLRFALALYAFQFFQLSEKSPFDVACCLLLKG